MGIMFREELTWKPRSVREGTISPGRSKISFRGWGRPFGRVIFDFRRLISSPILPRSKLILLNSKLAMRMSIALLAGNTTFRSSANLNRRPTLGEDSWTSEKQILKSSGARDDP